MKHPLSNMPDKGCLGNTTHSPAPFSTKVLGMKPRAGFLAYEIIFTAKSRLQ